MKLIRCVLSMLLMVALVGNVSYADADNQEQWVMDSVWGQMTDEQKYNADVKYKANAVRLSVEDFQLFAKCVEAESDKSDFNPNETTDGRVYCAACIWDRVYSDEFPNTVRGVLTEPGQFTTVSGGRCRISSTLASEWAIIKGRDSVLNGEIPSNMLFFNCIGYFRSHTDFAKVGDNYFSTDGSPEYFNKEDTHLDNEGILTITRGG